jgi:hypothetical protein
MSRLPPKGRVISLNTRAKAVLEFWASNFPQRTPTDHVFPSERHGAAGDKFAACAPFPLIARIMGWSTATTVRMGIATATSDTPH